MEALRCSCGSDEFRVEVNNIGSAGYRCVECDVRAGYSWEDGGFETTSNGELEAIDHA